jgi:hypothetical protein
MLTRRSFVTTMVGVGAVVATQSPIHAGLVHHRHEPLDDEGLRQLRRQAGHPFPVRRLRLPQMDLRTRRLHRPQGTPRLGKAGKASHG